jgi:hypothetical protein
MKQTKYLFLMLVAVLFAACSSDDNDNGNSNKGEGEKAVIAFDDFSSLINMSYSAMIKQYPNPSMQFGDFYIYENVKPNVETLTISVNPELQSVYMVMEKLKENAYKEADIDAYFKSKFKFIRVEKQDEYDDDGNVVGSTNRYTYANTAKEEDATLVITLTGNDLVSYSNPKNEPAVPDGPTLDDMTPEEAVSAFLLADQEEVDEEYPGVFSDMAGMYACFMEDNPWLAGIALVEEDGIYTKVILLYNEDLGDDDVVAYYEEEGYNCTKTGTNDDGDDEYIFISEWYTITYCAGRSEVIFTGEID